MPDKHRPVPRHKIQGFIGAFTTKEVQKPMVSGGVLPTLPPWAKWVGPQAETSPQKPLFSLEV